MLQFIVKCVVSGVLVAVVAEVAKRSPTFGAVVASLPLISLLAFLWLWHDTGDKEQIAALAQGTFWFVLPSLPLFLVLPALLRGGVGFWPSLGAACALTVGLYLIMVWVLGRLGVTL